VHALSVFSGCCAMVNTRCGERRSMIAALIWIALMSRSVCRSRSDAGLLARHFAGRDNP
jgi:hypothetical protein